MTNKALFAALEFFLIVVLRAGEANRRNMRSCDVIDFDNVNRAAKTNNLKLPNS